MANLKWFIPALLTAGLTVMLFIASAQIEMMGTLRQLAVKLSAIESSMWTRADQYQWVNDHFVPLRDEVLQHRRQK